MFRRSSFRTFNLTNGKHILLSLIECPGVTYNFDLFFAEKGWFHISFVLDMPFPLQQNPHPYFIGCSDRKREGFLNWNTYLCIAGCSASWYIPGLYANNYVTFFIYLFDS